MITQKMAASKDIAATWGGGRAEGAGPGRPAVRTCPEWSGPVRTTTTLQGIGPVFLTGVLPSSRISPSRLPSSSAKRPVRLQVPKGSGGPERGAVPRPQTHILIFLTFLWSADKSESRLPQVCCKHVTVDERMDLSLANEQQGFIPLEAI